MSKKTEQQKKIDAEITGALFDDFDRFEHFFVGNFKKLIFGAIALIVAVAVVFGTLAWRRATARAEAEKLSQARSASELEGLLAKAGNTPESRFARLRLARFYAAEGKYEAASREYAEVIASGAPAEMAGRMMLDEAYMFEQQKKFAEAAAKFAQVGANANYPDAIRIEGNCQAGRLYKALKKPKDAAMYLAKATSVKAPQNDYAIGYWQSMAQYLAR